MEGERRTKTAEEQIQRIFDDHASILAGSRQQLPGVLSRAATALVACFRAGGKVLLFGNGGSFSDALHIEGELQNRFQRDREGLPAICLGAGQATLTATANDYSYDVLFSRLVRALGRKGDVAVGLTTSGNSENVVGGLKTAREIGLTTIAMTGNEGGRAREHADILINVPATVTARIQEIHILAAHTLCELVEDELFGQAE